MKKHLVLSMLAISTMAASAQIVNVDSIMEETVRTGMLERQSPTYLKDYYTTSWDANWFAGVQVGGNAFYGNPVGCGDMFDRLSVSYGAYVGKWHNPYVGTRIAFNGGKFKDLYGKREDFYTFHADLMYNVTNHWMRDDQTQRRWDVIPFVGIGLIHGPEHYHENCPCDACNGSNKGLLVTAGIQGRYKVSDRAYVTAELGGMMTYNDFDNHGSRHNFGDGMLSFSVGMSYNIGKNGFSHPVDARPYIAQNDYLLNNYNKTQEANIALGNQHKMDKNTIEELKKALQTEGLLDKYGYLFNDKARNKRNYYQGLLSLRARMMAAREQAEKENEDTHCTHAADSAYEAVKGTILSQPVYFFFKRNTAKLTDDSQRVNLDEIAEVAKTHDLMLRIDGSADKATGSAKFNKKLSKERCKYIFKCLVKRGVDGKKIRTFSHGGVEEHERNEEDRNTRVSLYVEENKSQETNNINNTNENE